MLPVSSMRSASAGNAGAGVSNTPKLGTGAPARHTEATTVLFALDTEEHTLYVHRIEHRADVYKPRWPNSSKYPVQIKLSWMGVGLERRVDGGKMSAVVDPSWELPAFS